MRSCRYRTLVCTGGERAQFLLVLPIMYHGQCCKGSAVLDKGVIYRETGGGMHSISGSGDT